MREFVILLVFLVCYVASVTGGECNNVTGSTTNPESLGRLEEDAARIGLAVKLTDYTTSCACGIITQWHFYTRRNGTVIFYALDGDTVKGVTSVSVPALSYDNYYEIPLSSQMWISVKNGYSIGFVTPALPMITYNNSGNSYSSGIGKSEVALNESGDFGTATTGRQYAVRAYIETGHAPMFTNLPYTVSIYTHDVRMHIITVSATDLDPDDASNLALTASGLSTYFHFDMLSNVMIYNGGNTASQTFTVTVTANDGCLTNTDTVTIEMINEPPSFTNLPATVSIQEKSTGLPSIYTVTTTDPAGENVLCYLDSASSEFVMDATTHEVQVNYTAGGFVHDTRPAYDLLVRCVDADNTVYSVLNVDIMKNEPPVYTGATGFLPASVQVARTAGTLYTLAATDPEGDSLTYTLLTCSRNNCPISVSTGGVVTATQLPGPNYDLTIRVSDGYTDVDKILSILVSESDFNQRPDFTNLPATIYVNENTPTGTQIFKLMYSEINTWQVIDLSRRVVSDASANTFFTMDTNTGIVSVNAPIDYDTVSPKDVWITYRVRDDIPNGNRENLTIIYANVNEAPVISIGTSTITVDEGPRNSLFTDPGLDVTDPDLGDDANCKWSLDCGADSKYFYIKDVDRRIYLAREYDMDSGLSGTATCIVSAIDPKGLSSTGTLTLSINNINDNVPKFPYQRYLFLQNPDDPFFQKVADLTASDADSNIFGSTLGTITYSFDPTGSPSTFYQLDVNGVLYVRDVSSFSRGTTYSFIVYAVDSGGRTGSTTVSILFSEVESVTTTTTQRSYTFDDDFTNYIWLSIVCIFLSIALIIIAVMVWFDPVVHDFVAFKLMRIDECCRHKPKQPKRTVGKLTLTVNNKTLENDPDNALPWELLAKDSNVPEMNQIQEEITKRKERREVDYMKLTGRNVFEKGKGIRPATADVEVHSPPPEGRLSESPKYDSFKVEPDTSGQDNPAFDEGGPSNWEIITSRRSSVVNVTPIHEEAETNIDDDGDKGLDQSGFNYKTNQHLCLEF